MYKVSIRYECGQMVVLGSMQDGKVFDHMACAHAPVLICSLSSVTFIKANGEILTRHHFLAIVFLTFIDALQRAEP